MTSSIGSAAIFSEALRHLQLIYFHYVMEDVYYVRPLSLEYIRRYALRFMGKTVNMPHFNREHGRVRTRERDESKPGIKTLLPLLKNLTKRAILTILNIS